MLRISISCEFHCQLIILYSSWFLYVECFEQHNSNLRHSAWLPTEGKNKYFKLCFLHFIFFCFWCRNQDKWPKLNKILIVSCLLEYYLWILYILFSPYWIKHNQITSELFGVIFELIGLKLANNKKKNSVKSIIRRKLFVTTSVNCVYFCVHFKTFWKNRKNLNNATIHIF